MSKQASVEDAIGCTLAIFWLPALLVGGFLIKGYVLAKLWAWFVVTAFGARPLSVAEAIGLAIVVAFLTKDYSASPDKKDKESKGIWAVMLNGTIYTFIPPLLALLTGYIVSRYV